MESVVSFGFFLFTNWILTQSIRVEEESTTEASESPMKQRKAYLNRRRLNIAFSLGATYFVALIFSLKSSGGVLNPAFFWGSQLPRLMQGAVSINSSLCCLPYSTGPYVGGTLAGILYRWIISEGGLNKIAEGAIEKKYQFNDDFDQVVDEEKYLGYTKGYMDKALDNCV